jgi:2-dehydropantoate 2-reductase
MEGLVTIVVVGAGAIGMLVAGRLAQSSQRTVLLARPRVADEIARAGLRMLEGGQLSVIDRLVTIAEPAALAPEDRNPMLAILCVKGYDTAGALPTLAALDPQFILTLQNGIGNEETLAERFGAARVISGAITIPVDVEAPGRVAVMRRGGIGVAPMSPSARQAAGWVAGALGKAGFVVREYKDYRALKWSKALLNMLGNATAAILDMPVAEVYANPAMLDLERRAFLEALAVMRHSQIGVINLPRHPVRLLATAIRRAPPALVNPLLRKLVAGGRGSKPPSLHIELARGNPRSEGAFLYGAVACAAEAAGVEAPVNHALWQTLRSIASGETPWETYRRQPERLAAAIRGEPALVGHERGAE